MEVAIASGVSAHSNGAAERAHELRRAAEVRYLETYAPQRTWPFLAAMALFCAGLVGLGFLPSVHDVLRITPSALSAAMIVQFVAIATATIAARAPGGVLGRAHRIAEGVESLVCAAIGAALVHASGSAVSVLWLIIVFHLMNNTQEVLGSRVTRLGHSVCLGALALAFAFEGKTTDALIVAFFGALLVFLARTQALVSQRFLEVQVERDVLRRRLEGLIAQREQTRIARDLHDGFGASLAAIAWSADALAAGDATPECLHELAARARATLSELRTFVSGIRREDAPLEVVANELEAECRALLPPGCQLVFSRRGEGTIRREVNEQLGFLVREAVRNAAQHARPSEIEVRIVLDEAFELRVSNDGHPLPEDALGASRGGLAHLISRSAELGAVLTVERDNGRTSFVWRMSAERVRPTS